MNPTPNVPSIPNWADELSARSSLAEATLVALTLVATGIAVNYTRKTWNQAKKDEQRRRDAQAYNIKVLAHAITEDDGDLHHLAEAMRRDAQFLLPAFYIMVENAGPHPIRDLEVRLDRHIQTDSWREVVAGSLGRLEHVTDLAGHTRAFFVRSGTDSRDPHIPVQVSFEDEYGQHWTINEKGSREKASPATRGLLERLRVPARRPRAGGG